MDTVLLVIHMILAVSLVMVVMAQRAPQDGGGLAGGGSTMGGLFTARGSANLLTRVTAILATLFICTSLLMGVIASQQHKARNVAQALIEQEESAAKPEAEKAEPAPAPAPASTPAADSKTKDSKAAKPESTKSEAAKPAPKKVEEKDSAGIKIEDKKSDKKPAKTKTGTSSANGPEVPVSR